MGVRNLVRAWFKSRGVLALALAVLMLGFSGVGSASAVTKSASWSNTDWGSGLGAATAVSCAGQICNAVGSKMTVTSTRTTNSYSIGAGSAALDYNAISCVPGSCAQTGLKLGKTLFGNPRIRATTVEATVTSGSTFKLGPLVPYDSPELASISCVKGRVCLAVGVQAHATLKDCESTGSVYSNHEPCVVPVPLAVELVGGRWRGIPSIPLPVSPVAMIMGAGTGPWAALAGVSCVGASACIAVGNYGTTYGASEPFAESWNGTAFTEVPMASVTGASVATVNSVSCPKIGSCLAVGVATVGSTSTPFAEQLANGSWNLVTAVQPTGVKGSSLLSISCVRSGWCAAVGSETTNSGTAKPLAEIWNGSGFAHSTLSTNTAYPASKGGAQLAGVSCVAENNCTAVGNYYTKTGALGGWFLSAYATS